MFGIHPSTFKSTKVEPDFKSSNESSSVQGVGDAKSRSVLGEIEERDVILGKHERELVEHLRAGNWAGAALVLATTKELVGGDALDVNVQFSVFGTLKEGGHVTIKETTPLMCIAAGRYPRIYSYSYENNDAFKMLKAASYHKGFAKCSESYKVAQVSLLQGSMYLIVYTVLMAVVGVFFVIATALGAIIYMVCFPCSRNQSTVAIEEQVTRKQFGSERLLYLHDVICDDDWGKLASLQSDDFVRSVLCRELIKRGARIGSRDQYGMTAVNYACCSASYNCLSAMFHFKVVPSGLEIPDALKTFLDDECSAGISGKGRLIYRYAKTAAAHDSTSESNGCMANIWSAKTKERLLFPLWILFGAIHDVFYLASYIVVSCFGDDAEKAFPSHEDSIASIGLLGKSWQWGGSQKLKPQVPSSLELEKKLVKAFGAIPNDLDLLKVRNLLERFYDGDGRHELEQFYHFSDNLVIGDCLESSRAMILSSVDEALDSERDQSEMKRQTALRAQRQAQREEFEDSYHSHSWRSHSIGPAYVFRDPRHASYICAMCCCMPTMPTSPHLLQATEIIILRVMFNTPHEIPAISREYLDSWLKLFLKDVRVPKMSMSDGLIDRFERAD